MKKILFISALLVFPLFASEDWTTTPHEGSSVVLNEGRYRPLVPAGSVTPALVSVPFGTKATVLIISHSLQPSSIEMEPKLYSIQTQDGKLLVVEAQALFEVDGVLNEYRWGTRGRTAEEVERECSQQVLKELYGKAF